MYATRNQLSDYENLKSKEDSYRNVHSHASDGCDSNFLDCQNVDEDPQYDPSRDGLTCVVPNQIVQLHNDITAGASYADTIQDMLMNASISYNQVTKPLPFQT